jgi:hypothetical protein
VLIFRDWSAIESQLGQFVDVFIEEFLEPKKHGLAGRAD